jgi:FlaA1/EpsC-like NDP-sugar epimerase
MRNRFVLLLDLPLIAAAALFAFVLRFEWTFAASRHEYLLFLIGAVLLKPPVFLAFGLYRRYWRYTSVADLPLIAAGVTGASLAMGAFVIVAVTTGLMQEFSRTVLVTDWLLTFLAVSGFRLSIRLVFEATHGSGGPQHDIRRVLVVGAGDAGVMVVREMRRNPSLGLVPVAFVDDDPGKRGKRIHSLPVVGPLKELPAAVERYRVQEVVIAMPKAPGSIVRRVAEATRQLNLRPRILPGVYELLDEQVSVSRLREVDISDLLRREPISSGGLMIDYLAGEIVLVTGAGGSIGSELCRQIAAAAPSRLILLGHGENSIFEVHGQLVASSPMLDVVPVIADIRNIERLDEAFREYTPRVVFHAAAHKHVPLMEQNPSEAISNNVGGTRNVVECCLRYGVERFVLISTDKAVAPSSVMGATKRVAELLVRSAAQRSHRNFSIVRFGNVLGSRGSVIGTFKRQIEAGGPITITHPDMQRFFMTIPEAVHLVLQAGGLGGHGDLFVLNMGRPLRITDLAQDLIKLSGASIDDIPIVYTGLRPGEKLVESLFEPDAVVTSTTNDQILRVVEPNEPDQSLVERMVRRLAIEQNALDVEDLRRLLQEVVPTYAAPRQPNVIRH